MSKTIAVHVQYESFYISLPSSAQLQREMAAYCWYIYLELEPGITYLAWEGSETNRRSEQTWEIVKFGSKILIQFC